MLFIKNMGCPEWARRSSGSSSTTWKGVLWLWSIFWYVRTSDSSILVCFHTFTKLTLSWQRRWIQSNLMVFLYVPPQVHGLVIVNYIVARSNERENWCLHNYLNPDTPASLHMCAQLINLIAKWLISMFAPKWLISVFAPPLKLSRAPSLRGLEGIKSSDRELIFFRNSRLLVCFLSTLFTLKRTCSLFCCRDTHESKYHHFNQRIS